MSENAVEDESNNRDLHNDRSSVVYGCSAAISTNSTAKLLATRRFNRNIFSIGAAALGDIGLSSATAWNQIKSTLTQKNFIT